MLNSLRRVLTRTFQFWTGTPAFDDLFELKEVLLGVVLIAFTRTVADFFLWTRNLLLFPSVFILWSFYIISLCLSTAFLLSRLIPRLTFRQALTLAVCVYWVIPLVPLFSLPPWEKAWGLGRFATVSFFQWIPTFMIERNYLPLGMLVVSPLILLKTTWVLVPTARVPWWQAFFITLLVLLVIYVYYYQWIWNVTVIATFEKGFTGWDMVLAGYIAYSFLSQVITFLLTPVLARAFGSFPLWGYMAVSGAILLGLLFIPHVGFLPMLLTPGRP